MRTMVTLPSAHIYEPRSVNPLKPREGLIVNCMSIDLIIKDYSALTGEYKHYLLIKEQVFYINDDDLKKILQISLDNDCAMKLQ